MDESSLLFPVADQDQVRSLAGLFDAGQEGDRR